MLYRRFALGVPTPSMECAARAVFPLLAALVIPACANLTPDQGMGSVQDVSHSVLNKDAVKLTSEDNARDAQVRVKVLLRTPLTVENAVQIALLNNRGLQAAYNELGLTEAQQASSAMPPNPVFSWSNISNGAGLELERQVAVNVIAILTLRRRQDIAALRFRAAQFKAMNETFRVAAETRRAFYRAVAAAQTVGFLERAGLAAEAVSDLTAKLGESGALSKLDQAREHSFSAEVSGQVAVARLQSGMEREKLTRLMGLWGSDTGFRLPIELKPLPPRPQSMEMAEQEAIRNRVDLEMARLGLDALSKSYGLTNATRFVDVLEVSARSKHDKQGVIDAGLPRTDNVVRRGADVRLEIPIFDFNEAKVQEAREAYLRAVNQLIDKAVTIRAEARIAYAGYRGSYDIAKHYRDNIAPLNKTISDEALLRYNGMLTDLFQLLVDARRQVTSNVAGIDALRDFWLATVDLQTALTGGGPSSDPSTQGVTAVSTQLAE